MPDSAQRALIIADDFTGSCDTGAALASASDPCPLVLADEASGAVWLEREAWSVAVCDTESRHLPAEAAAGRVSAVAGAGERRGVELLYKKIDSTLRGNVGAEVAAAAASAPGRTIVVAPAFPDAGRTTEGGRCLVRGVPVDRTEFARDRLAPVRTARIADLFGRSAREVAPADLPAALAARGAGDLLVVDARTNDDLAQIAAIVESRLASLLLVGSAGLAAALGPYVRRVSSDLPNAAVPRAGRVLAVVGSLSERSRVQVERLPALIERVALHPQRPDEAEARALAVLAEGRGAAVVSERPGRGGSSPAETVAAALAGVARAAAARFADLGLVLTGGDTARATVRALGATAIVVRGEIAPGVPRVGIRSAAGAGGAEIPAVTKAGGFGDDDILERAFGALQEA